MAKKRRITHVGVSLLGPPEEAGEDPTEEATESPGQEAAEDTSETTPSSVTVDLPVDLISQDGVAPEEGDQVSAQIDATVEAVQGRIATLSIDAVDGQAVGNQVQKGNPPEKLADMAARLRTQAATKPTMNFG
jgi:hypothetical protein